ncbi:hypothetical protein L6164_010052 [Bauhinia variegata]|uniref:Uncharacterized protein n=1 Tax=Bauhinia variegata TaxID=167791 RepID=A0ACB9PLW7_BAUVA|nr:hypothetical protein L6164_010052 [Bauhinia variegata]
MFPGAMSNSTSLSEDASVPSGIRVQDFAGLNGVVPTISPQHPQKIKKKRCLPGNPDPDAEVIALSPKTLLATNRFVCEICNKGFQRDQNLQLHRRGHNLPWKLKQRNGNEVRKKAYVCPEPSCVHHNPSRALGDLTGIKKHYCRKHGEKKWKCDKCSKIYAVQSDWKAHSKTCGTREYRCDCGILFSRKDSFITHRAFCDALAEESARQISATNPLVQSLFLFPNQQNFLNPWDPSPENPNPNNFANAGAALQVKPEAQHFQIPTLSSSFLHQPQHQNSKISMAMINSPFHVTMQPSANNATSAHMSATALLQKAATVGPTAIPGPGSASVVGVGQVGHVTEPGMAEFGTLSQLHPVDHDYVNARGFASRNLNNDRFTRDFLGLTGNTNGGSDGGNNGAVDVKVNVKDMLTFTGGVEYQPYEHHHHHTLFKSQQSFGFVGTTTAPEAWGNC